MTILRWLEVGHRFHELVTLCFWLVVYYDFFSRVLNLSLSDFVSRLMMLLDVVWLQVFNLLVINGTHIIYEFRSVVISRDHHTLWWSRSYCKTDPFQTNASYVRQLVSKLWSETLVAKSYISLTERTVFDNLVDWTCSTVMSLRIDATRTPGDSA